MLQKISAQDLLHKEINLLQPYLTENRLERIETILQNRTDHLTIALDRVVNQHNISAITRSCEGMGLTHLNIIKSEVSKNQFSNTIASSSHKWIQISKFDNSEQALVPYKNEGYKIWVAHTGGESIDIHQIKIPDKLVIVMGAEKTGPSEETKSFADHFFFLPIVGFIESYNVSVATALTLFYLRENKKFSSISEDRYLELKNYYYKKSIKFSNHILKRFC